MLFHHSIFKTLTNSFLNITTFPLFSFVLSSCTFRMRSIFEFLKHRVSKQKIRFTEGGFDLDLTCILYVAGFARNYGILPSSSLLTLFGQELFLKHANMVVRPWSDWNSAFSSIFVDCGVCWFSLYSQVIGYESGEIRLQLEDWPVYEEFLFLWYLLVNCSKGRCLTSKLLLVRRNGDSRRRGLILI